MPNVHLKSDDRLQLCLKFAGSLLTLHKKILDMILIFKILHGHFCEFSLNNFFSSFFGLITDMWHIKLHKKKYPKIIFQLKISRQIGSRQENWPKFSGKSRKSKIFIFITNPGRTLTSLLVNVLSRN